MDIDNVRYIIQKLYENEIFSLRQFLIGKKDTFIFCSKKEISKDFFNDYVKVINLISTKKGTLYFNLLSRTMLSVTYDKGKYLMIDEIKKFDLSYYDNILLVGFLLDIPFCCSESYAKDFEKRSTKEPMLEGYAPARRYINQLKSYGIKKDKFGVEIKKDKIGYKYFIPCHPKCKRALLKYLIWNL